MYGHMMLHNVDHVEHTNKPSTSPLSHDTHDIKVFFSDGTYFNIFCFLPTITVENKSDGV